MDRCIRAFRVWKMTASSLVCSGSMTSGVENGKEEVTLLGRGQGKEEKTPRVQNIKRSPLPGSRKRGSSGCNLGTSLHSGSDAGGLRESSAK